MKPPRVAVLLLSVASVAACNKADAPRADDPKVEAVPADPGPAVSAAGGPRAGATPVSECPRSLGGEERQIDRVISKDCGPVAVVEDYWVEGGSLTLEAGATLEFKDGARLIVGAHDSAKLIIAGTAAAPVTLTSASDKVAGAWKGVELGDKAARSQIAGAIVEFVGDREAALRIAAKDVAITGTTIRETAGPALRIDGEGSLAAFSGNHLSKLGERVAIVASPAAVAGVAGGNRFDAGAVIRVLGGSLGAPTTWPNPGIPLLLTEELHLDATGSARASLTLSPGTDLQFGPEGRIAVGSGALGGLVARGTAEAPITFTASERREAGGWSGLRVWSHGEGEFEHAAFEFGGSEASEGALMVDAGSLSLRHVTFRSNRAGVVLRGAATLRGFADNRFAATPLAVDLPPTLVGALGEGNAFDAEARILVEPGEVTAKATWAAHGAPLELVGTVHVDAELSLDAGLQVLARPEAGLEFGNSAAATLIARGTVGAPIHFGATAGSWPGLKFHSHARASVLEHVVLGQTGEEPAVWAAGGAEVRLDNVTCAGCKAAVVGWECGAKVSQSAVLASEGTPAIAAPPQGC